MEPVTHASDKTAKTCKILVQVGICGGDSAVKTGFLDYMVM